MADETRRSRRETRDHAFCDFCRQLADHERVAVVKSLRPLWSVAQIAGACGMDERSVLRSPSYQRLREIDRARPVGASQWRGRVRRRIDRFADIEGFSHPDRPDA